MQTKNETRKETCLFFPLTLGLSDLLFRSLMALFQVPTISFVSNIVGPVWAIVLSISDGFVPSTVAVFLT